MNCIYLGDFEQISFYYCMPGSFLFLFVYLPFPSRWFIVMRKIEKKPEWRIIWTKEENTIFFSLFTLG